MKRSLLLFLLAVCAASCGSDRGPITPPGPPPVIEPPPPPPPPPPDPPTLAVETILAFGDSLTHGPDPAESGLTVSNIHDHGTLGESISYPFKLHAMLVNTYTGQTETIKVFNAGQGGEAVSSSKAKERMLAELARFRPEVLLLMHGANDLLREVPIQRIVDHMEELIQLAHAGGVKRVFLASLPPQVETIASEEVPEYNKELRKMSASAGATFVDVFANIETQTMMEEDGLHLREIGNQKIAELFYEALKAAFHREPGS